MVYKIERPEFSGEMVLKFKGDKMRSDSTQEHSSIVDGKTRDVITLDHARKSYTKTSAGTVKALQEKAKKSGAVPKPGAAAGTGAAAKPKLVATGKTEKIGGHDTEEYTTEGSGMTIHYWFAKNFPDWATLQQLLLKMQNSLGSGSLPGAADFPGMPVKTVTDVAGQKITYTLVSVKAEAVDDAVFEIPADYKERPVPQPAAPGGK